MAIIRMGAQDEASEIEYSNLTSGLSATTVQGAIDEIGVSQPSYLDNLTDVTITSISTNDVLSWNGIAWVNSSAVSAFTESYTSSDQTITSAGTLTLAHGLTAAPELIQLRLKCVTAELGFSINDEMIISSGYLDTQKGASVVPDATNINIKYGVATNSFTIIRKDTGSHALATNANWKLIVKAWR